MVMFLENILNDACLPKNNKDIAALKLNAGELIELMLENNGSDLSYKITRMQSQKELFDRLNDLIKSLLNKNIMQTDERLILVCAFERLLELFNNSILKMNTCAKDFDDILNGDEREWIIEYEGKEDDLFIRAQDLVYDDIDRQEYRSNCSMEDSVDYRDFDSDGENDDDAVSFAADDDDLSNQSLYNEDAVKVIGSVLPAMTKAIMLNHPNFNNAEAINYDLLGGGKYNATSPLKADLSRKSNLFKLFKNADSQIGSTKNIKDDAQNKTPKSAKGKHLRSDTSNMTGLRLVNPNGMQEIEVKIGSQDYLTGNFYNSAPRKQEGINANY